jgi:hypothetical protein
MAKAYDGDELAQRIFSVSMAGIMIFILVVFIFIL